MKIKIICANCGKKRDGASYINSDGDLVLLVDECGCRKNEIHQCIEKQ